MDKPTDQQGQLSSRQEQQWFRVWVASLTLFFVVAGASSLTFLLRTKHAEGTRRQQILDPAAPEPGVTSADDSSIEQAVPVEVGFYVERVPELSTRDATWTVVFDVWFRWQGEDVRPAEGLVVMEGTVESRDKLAEYHDQRTHYERYRVVAKITYAFPAAEVPLDSHLLILAVENGETVRQKLVFVPDLESTSISSRIAVPGYTIARWEVLEKAHSSRMTAMLLLRDLFNMNLKECMEVDSCHLESD